MARQRSLRSKAVHLISGLTTVLLNPISDKPSLNPSQVGEARAAFNTHLDSIPEEGEDLMEGPDTSSFTAFLYSFIKDDYFTAAKNHEDENHDKGEAESSDNKAESEAESVNLVRESGGKRGLISMGKQSIGKVINYASRLVGFRNQAAERKPESATNTEDKNECQDDYGREDGLEKSSNEEFSLTDLPDMSEPSQLLSLEARIKLNASLPPLLRGRKWVLIYSTERHGISLSTLYNRSALCPGLSLLVVGDRGGAVFGGLVEAPLKASTTRRYQGTSSTFVFSDVLGQPVIYHPTGANRYYTLCSPDFLALGGGPHFALYLDGDLLNGSSGASETYGNPCLACSENFHVRKVELWGFVYGSKYEEMLAVSQNEATGICRW